MRGSRRMPVSAAAAEAAWVTWEGRRGPEQGRGADILEAPPHQVRSSQRGALGAGARPGVGLATGRKEDSPLGPGLGRPSHSPRYLGVLGVPSLPRCGVGPRPTPRNTNADPMLAFPNRRPVGASLGPWSSCLWSGALSVPPGPGLLPDVQSSTSDLQLTSSSCLSNLCRPPAHTASIRR